MKVAERDRVDRLEVASAHLRGVEREDYQEPSDMQVMGLLAEAEVLGRIRESGTIGGQIAA